MEISTGLNKFIPTSYIFWPGDVLGLLKHLVRDWILICWWTYQMTDAIVAVPDVVGFRTELLMLVLLSLKGLLCLLCMLYILTSIIGSLLFFRVVYGGRLSVLCHRQVAVSFFKENLLKHALSRGHVVSIELHIDLLIRMLAHFLELNLYLPDSAIVRRLLSRVGILVW